MIAVRREVRTAFENLDLTGSKDNGGQDPARPYEATKYLLGKRHWKQTSVPCPRAKNCPIKEATALSAAVQTMLCKVETF